jgi:hypothetical protein
MKGYRLEAAEPKRLLPALLHKTADEVFRVCLEDLVNLVKKIIEFCLELFASFGTLGSVIH